MKKQVKWNQITYCTFSVFAMYKRASRHKDFQLKSNHNFLAFIKYFTRNAYKYRIAKIHANYILHNSVYSLPCFILQLFS